MYSQEFGTFIESGKIEIFPKNGKPGQLHVDRMGNLFMFDGSMWAIISGRGLSKAFINELSHYLNKFDPFDPINWLKNDLESLFDNPTPQEEIAIKRVIKITKDIQNTRLHI